MTIQVCDDICYEMFRLQQALKPAKDGAVRNGQQSRPVNAEEYEQMRIL